MMLEERAFLCTCVFLAFLLQCVAGEPLPPFNLKCEGNTVGLSIEQLAKISKQPLFTTDSHHPRLSWNVAHTDRGAYQKAFQVTVGELYQQLRSVIWDSGVVHGQETSITYAGPSLKSGSLYFWRVIWWDQEGSSAESIETGHFMTGVLDPRDWDSAKWITAPSDIAHAPLISKKFSVDQATVSKATLFISGLGFFKVSVTGQDLNSRYNPPIALTPGWTNYEVRVPYGVYEVTDEIKQSSQASIDVILGIAWRNSSIYILKDPPPPRPDSVRRVLRVILNVTYTNGSTLSVMTDETWDCSQSPYMYDSIYNGETYDALMAQKKAPNVKAVATPGPYGAMYLPPIPYIAEMGTDKAIKIYPLQSDPSKQIVDFGNNSAGVCLLNVKDLPSGTTVQIKHAEVLMHPPYGTMDGSLFYANLRDALQTDIYTSNGSADTYQPSLTYHGFRYAEVSGYTRDLTADDISKVIIHSNLQLNGHLNTSNPILNNIQQNVVRGQLSNLMSVPTDCDQRNERLGWMGDAGLSAESMALNFHMEAFHPHFLQLIADEQINGSVPDVVPFYRGGSRPADPSWGAAFPEIVWVVNQLYGDNETARTFFQPLLRYIEYMISKIPPEGIGDLYAYYGDWCPPPPHPKVNTSFTSAFSLLNNINQTQELARRLGYLENATMLQQLFKEQSESFNKAFLMNGTYLNGLQITYVLPLYLGIVPDDIKDDFTKTFLNQLIGSDQTHITAGIIGAKFILPVLTQLDQHSIAIDIAQQIDYPSWGFMIHNPYEPATTIWELWNGFNGSASMDSRNHHMFSSVSGWMMTEMVGLEIPKGSYGFKEVHFHPARTLDLSHASVSLKQPKPVRMTWQRNGGIQCAKSPEDQSSINPGLPKHDGLKLSCGEEGGVIAEVLFASFGNPTGTCGQYKRGSCHATNSVAVVEKLCLGKSDCHVPTDANFWSDVCPGDAKWLSVAVQCKSTGQSHPDYKFSSLSVDLDIPVGSSGVVFLPAHGKADLMVWEGEKVVWKRQQFVGGVHGILSSQWLPQSDALRLDLSSGSYSFTVRGETPERRCLDSRKEGDILFLKCNLSEVISGVDWVSYGNPETSDDCCFSHAFGDCHAGSSRMAIENECIGKHHCKIPVMDKFFGRKLCSSGKDGRRLIVEYTCNKRQ